MNNFDTGYLVSISLNLKSFSRKPKHPFNLIADCTYCNSTNGLPPSIVSGVKIQFMK